MNYLINRPWLYMAMVYESGVDVASKSTAYGHHFPPKVAITADLGLLILLCQGAAPST